MKAGKTKKRSRKTSHGVACLIRGFIARIASAGSVFLWYMAVLRYFSQKAGVAAPKKIQGRSMVDLLSGI